VISALFEFEAIRCRTLHPTARRIVMMFDFDEYDLLTIFVVSVVVIFAASEIGRRYGVFARGRGRDNDATLEAAVLGLLALMISFTFAMALTLFEARRDAVLNEANAIGTTALRARLLPAPHDARAVKLLRDYVQIRLDLYRRAPSARELDAAIDRSNAIQTSLWQEVKAVEAVEKGMVPTGLFIQTLNEMIDNQEKRVTAYRNRVPDIALMALYAIAFIAVAFAGFGAELDSRRSRLPVYLTGMIVCAVLLLIQDLGRPDAGLIWAGQQPMIDTAASIAAFPD
jgi:hypothetical protein